MYHCHFFLSVLLKQLKFRIWFKNHGSLVVVSGLFSQNWAQRGHLRKSYVLSTPSTLLYSSCLLTACLGGTVVVTPWSPSPLFLLSEKHSLVEACCLTYIYFVRNKNKVSVPCLGATPELSICLIVWNFDANVFSLAYAIHAFSSIWAEDSCQVQYQSLFYFSFFFLGEGYKNQKINF